jgi:plastocyanin
LNPAETAAATLLAADPPAGPHAGSNIVKIVNFSFTPQTLIVRAGTKVTWIKKDDVPHTVTSGDKAFKSLMLDTDDQFSYTFSIPSARAPCGAILTSLGSNWPRTATRSCWAAMTS